MEIVHKDAYYKSRYTFNPSRVIAWKEIVRFHSKFIPEGSIVVDLGAGYCDFINNVSANKRYAVDVSPELPQYADKEIIQIPEVAWNMSSIPNQSVDIVHASNLFEHFTDEELSKTMLEVKRILKKGGKLILMQPNYRLSYKNYFDDPTHKKVFSDAALESFLVSCDMNIILKKAKFLPFSLKSKPSALPLFLLSLVVKMYINSPVKLFAGQMLFISEKK